MSGRTRDDPWDNLKMLKVIYKEGSELVGDMSLLSKFRRSLEGIQVEQWQK